MIYKIVHTTNYEFDKKVFLEPHTLRLMPRSDNFQTLLDFSFIFKPKEAGSSLNLDLDGNRTISVWFKDTHKKLQIKSSSKVELKKANPFDYLITDPNTIKLPLRYERDLLKPLAPYIVMQKKPSKNLIDFSRQILDKSANSTIGYLNNLCSYIHSNFEKIDREKGEPLPSRDTLKKSRGSCRDFAILFMESCRIFGLAARFVSGYLIQDNSGENNELHAWAEVYLPGGGWRGYDPSTGLAVSNSHVVLASGYSSTLAAPVSGFFRGDVPGSRLTFKISIKSVE